MTSLSWAIPTGLDDDDDDNGDGNEDDTWYLGSVPTFRPNVAYSLYGILQGQEDRGCSKKTYINSFFTTQGVESFTNAMAAAGLTDRFAYADGQNQDNEGGSDPTSTCNQVDYDSNDNNQDEEQADDVDDAGQRRWRRHLNNNGDNYNYVNGAKIYSNTASYGLGCRRSRQPPTFVMQTYSGDYCDANAIVAVKDKLQDFNSRLAETSCVLIYTHGDSGYDLDDSGDRESPLALLATSKSCQVHDGSGTCPDPFGKLKHYESKLSRATGIQGRRIWLTVRQANIASWTMIGVGMLAAMIGLCMCIKKCMSRKRRFGVFRRSSKSRSGASHKSPIGSGKDVSSRRSAFISGSSSSGIGSSRRSSDSFSTKVSRFSTRSRSRSRTREKRNRRSSSRTSRTSKKNSRKLLPFFSR
jgi:hypothetical protein